MDQVAEYNQALCERVHDMRTAAGFSQSEMADQLGLRLATWKHYEYRTPLPAYLMIPVTKLLKVSVNYLLTGSRHER
jgi:hypothetical protein